MKVRTAVFPVAGLGTRLLPATKSIPKEMVTLIDKPLIQYAVEEVIAAGIERVIFVSARSKRALEDHFDYSPELEYQLEGNNKNELLEEMKRISEMCDITYVRQKNPKGLGHAVLCARDAVGREPFAVILPDDIIMSKTPVTAQLIEQFNQTKKSVISLMEVPEGDTSKYGIVVPGEKVNDRLMRLEGMVEKPKENPPSNLAIIGRYILTNEVMDALENIPRGAGGEIQLTDAILEVAKQSRVYGYHFEGKRFDCGNRFGLFEAAVNFALEREDMREHAMNVIKGMQI
ncbi:UTP--glucose-1-phosphate uridylyltransferase GalU [Seleniivibrio woodruffii]|uniref:UTP--glucose-1-phosphate uridylyltransferase n=1 Tax=Seleniivibrio woodruffii TaxID=1078050 RepID=A0A4V2PRL0_9BACT|nr:UTP--glucose-1-phosphate uridylyltransferase GalU [Seleniivibrio woodruffii]TCK58331.1 UDP-glucose pyrophosphorylase [Seleniivibrio woodruffii]TVZ36705.1 UTP--glucose-1-phosphate uridylyltransferase [Seleniivibrio woodruffii]